MSAVAPSILDAIPAVRTTQTTVELETPADRRAAARGSVIASIISAFLWVGMFGLASILTR